jgi:SAM-dependent methyltransferase
MYSLFRRLVGRDSARQVYAREHLRAEPGQRVLDLGCGTGDILSYLPPVRYMGYDISPAYVEHARRRFGTAGEFRCGAVTEALPVEAAAFDLVIAHGVLHHLDDQTATGLFRVARRALVPGGRLVTFDGCYVEGQSAAARLVLSLDRGEHVRELAEHERLAREVFDRVRSTVRHDLIRIPYTHVILECTA